MGYIVRNIHLLDIVEPPPSPRPPYLRGGGGRSFKKLSHLGGWGGGGTKKFAQKGG